MMSESHDWPSIRFSALSHRSIALSVGKAAACIFIRGKNDVRVLVSLAIEDYIWSLYLIRIYS